jgi:hypothetical protein
MARQRERRLLAEWIWEYHPDVPIHYNYPLGEHAEELGHRTYMTLAPRCDAIYVDDDVVFIIEAKIVDEFKGIAELMNYKRLVPKTTSLRQYIGNPIELILLRAREKPDVKDAAIEAGITPVLFRPKWVRDYLAELVQKKRSR